MILAEEQRNKPRLEKQFKKVSDIDSVGLFTNEFLLGYIASFTNYSTHPQEWRNLWSKLQFLKTMVISQAINVEDVIQIVQSALFHGSTENPFFREESLNVIIEAIGKNYENIVKNPKHFKEKCGNTTNEPKNEPVIFHQAEEPKQNLPQLFNEINKTAISSSLHFHELPEREKISFFKKTDLNNLYHSTNGEQKFFCVQKKPTHEKKDSLSQSFSKIMPGQIYSSKREKLQPYKQAVNNQNKHKPTFLNILSERKRVQSSLNNHQQANPRLNKQKSTKYEIQGMKSSTRSFSPVRIHTISKDTIKQPNKLSPHKLYNLANTEEARAPNLLELNRAKRELNEIMAESSFLLKSVPLHKTSPQRKTQQLQAIARKEQISSIGMQCPICCQQILIGEACPVSCGHILHKKCLNPYFKSKLEVKSLPILCPEEGCMKEISLDDMQEYIDKELRDKYYEFSLHLYVDQNSTMCWCPTPGCSAIFSIETHSNSYNCPSCKKTYCSKCRSPPHEGLRCEQSRDMKNLAEEDKQFVDFAKAAQYKQCPNCHFWVQKNKGCNHMTCRCKYQFCYKCGIHFQLCQCQHSEYSDYYSDYSDFSDFDF